MDVVTLKEAILQRFKASPKIVVYLVIVLICVALLLFTGNDTETTNSSLDFPQADTEYAKLIERQLEDIISKIEGAGKVNVMVTVGGTVSYEYAQDISQSDSKTDSEIVIISNDEALVKRIENPEISGVLVICDGGSSSIIKEKILNAVATVLDISSNKVYITK